MPLLPANTKIRALLLVAAISLTIFLTYEIVEVHFLQSTPMSLLRKLHILRGIGTTFLCAVVVIVYLRRPLSASLPPSVGIEPRREGTLDQIAWFVQLRWLAVVAVASAVLASQHVLHLLPEEVTVALWIGCGALLATNAFYAVRAVSCARPRLYLLSQIFTDVLLIAYLLHFSGGLENPLFILFIFHVILASILLSRHEACAVTGFIIILFFALGALEYANVLSHYTLKLFPHVGGRDGAGPAVEHAAHSLPFLIGMSGAFAALAAGTAYFTTALVGHLREKQVQLLHSERLSTLGQLVAYLAHEINNPIGIISTRMKLLLSDDENLRSEEFCRESAEIADRQAARVSQVVHSLLGYAKKHPSEDSACRLDEAAHEALNLLEIESRRPGIRVAAEGIRSSARVPMSRHELVQVFVNLLQNAADAMPAGGLLTVKTSVASGRARADVTDTGDGIAPETLPRIFEPFFTTKSRQGGTGLGLPICRSLLKAAGGAIEANSPPAQGSTFTLTLPLAGEEARA